MQSQTNFNRRTARTIDVVARVQRAKLFNQRPGEPIVLSIWSSHSKSRLMVTMTEAEALDLMSQLYAVTDKEARESLSSPTPR